MEIRDILDFLKQTQNSKKFSFPLQIHWEIPQLCTCVNDLGNGQ